MTQQNKLIKRLRKGWLNSLDAVYECDCLKLTTRVNEVAFLLKINLSLASGRFANEQTNKQDALFSIDELEEM